MNYSCRKCDVKCHRHGKIGNKQRWKCSRCGCTQFRVYKRKSFNKSRETVLKRLNQENVGIRGIARLMGVSPTQVIRCMLQLSSLVKRADNYEYGQEYELDEIWSYVGNKNQECWIIWAINRRTRVVVDFIIGKRTKENVRGLIEKLKLLHPKSVRTDKWSGYDKLFFDFPVGVHKKGRRITNRIERQGATLRNSLKRLNRKTISFSKSEKMLEATILLYMESCNWRPYRSGYILREPAF